LTEDKKGQATQLGGGQGLLAVAERLRTIPAFGEIWSKIKKGNDGTTLR